MFYRGTAMDYGRRQRVLQQLDTTPFGDRAGGPRAPFITSMPACSAARIYDESFVYQGNFLGATFINSAAPSLVNCSHPTLFLMPDLQHYGILTFNGTEFVAGNQLSTGQPMIEISTR